MYHGCTSFPLTGSSQIPFVPILSLSTHDVGGGVGLRVPLDLYTIGHFAFQRPSFFRDL